MRRANKLKLFASFTILLIASGWVIRIWPYRGSSPVRGVFFANNFYGMVYIAEHGQLLQASAIDTMGQVGNNVLSSVADPLRSLMGGIIAIVLGYQDTPEQVAFILTQTPYQGVFLFPAVLLLMFRAGSFLSSIRAYSIALIFGLFGSYEIIYATNSGSSNAAVGWSLFLIALWAIHRNRQSDGDWRYKFILVLTYIAIPAWYHTMGVIFLFVLLVISAIESRLHGDGNAIVYFAYPIIAFTHYSEIAVTYFTGYIRKLAAISARLAELSLTSTATTYQYQVQTETSLLSRAGSLFSKAVIGTLFVAYGALALRYTILRGRSNQDEWLPIKYLSSMPLVFAVIYMGYGLVLGLFRTFQYAVIVLPLVIAVSVRQYIPQMEVSTRQTLTVVFLIMMVVATATTTAYLTTPGRDSGLIERNEYASAQWLDDTAPNDVIIFTDYRLSPSLLVQSRFGISAIWPRDSVSTDRKFKQIYYSEDGDVAAEAISNERVAGESPEYVIMSSKMTDSSVGVNANGRRFREMSQEEFEKFGHTERLSQVYQSEDTVIYKANG